MTLEQMQKRGSLDKDKFECNQQALVRVIENKYKNQVSEVMETQKQIQEDLKLKNKQLEQDLRKAQERLHIETRGKMNECGSLEKKLSDLQENDRKQA